MAERTRYERTRMKGLVGRARELDAVDEALARLAEVEPWMIEVVGEPGIGKSSLLSELAARAVARDYLVLGGRAAEFERDVPFGLIVDALNDYLGSLQSSFLGGLDERTLGELASIFPALSGFVSELESVDMPGDRSMAAGGDLAARAPLGG